MIILCMTCTLILSTSELEKGTYVGIRIMYTRKQSYNEWENHYNYPFCEIRMLMRIA